MFTKRQTFIDIPEITTLFYGDPVVKAKIEASIATRVLLDASLSQKKTDSSGDEPQKKLALDTVIKTVGDKARACSVYFDEQGLPSIEAVLKKPKSYYDKQTDEDIASVIAGVRKILFTNETPLTPYKVNTAFFTLMDGQVDEMLLWLPAPASAVENQNAGNKQVNKYIGVLSKQYDGLDMLGYQLFRGYKPR